MVSKIVNLRLAKLRKSRRITENVGQCKRNIKKIVGLSFSNTPEDQDSKGRVSAVTEEY